MTKLEMLNVLKEKIKTCEKCPELVANRTQVVLNSGNPESKILFLGHSPGETEDQLGEVFIGKAGQLLTNILTACNINRPHDAYLCNPVCCRPPKNRNPTNQELENCSPFLKLQIKIVKPKLIVCLGAIAAKALLNTTDSISSMRGKILEYQDDNFICKVIFTYHPSYALRTGNKAKKMIWDDLQIINQIL